ncbi:MAG: hypothetical protein K6E67_00330 [Prevotella sp.]|nr:hypothetical protein [Prevotella sp.]
MKKFLMAAVALICMTMTSVVFTSCGSDDDDNSPVNKEYTLKVSLQMISEGNISQAGLEYMNSEFNQEVTNKFTGFYDAKSAVDEIVNKSLTAIKNIPLYGDGCEYKIYFKLFDASKSQVYQKTIYVKDDGYKLED